MGFIVAPWVWKHIISYKQVSSRMAILRMKVHGGSMAIISAYAPPSTQKHPYDERQKYYREFGDAVGQVSVHGPKFILGDINARVLRQLPSEEAIVGPGVSGSEDMQIAKRSNRFLFMELCHRKNMTLANTMQKQKPDDLAAYRDLSTTSTDAVTYPAYAQLDYVLAEHSRAHRVLKAIVARFAPLASHHHLLLPHLAVYMPKVKRHEKKSKPDRSALNFCQADGRRDGGANLGEFT